MHTESVEDFFAIICAKTIKENLKTFFKFVFRIKNYDNESMEWLYRKLSYWQTNIHSLYNDYMVILEDSYNWEKDSMKETYRRNFGAFEYEYKGLRYKIPVKLCKEINEFNDHVRFILGNVFFLLKVKKI